MAEDLLYQINNAISLCELASALQRDNCYNDDGFVAGGIADGFVDDEVKECYTTCELYNWLEHSSQNMYSVTDLNLPAIDNDIRYKLLLEPDQTKIDWAEFWMERHHWMETFFDDEIGLSALTKVT